MKRITLTAVIIILTLITLQAQNISDIQEIRELYKQAKKDIAQSENKQGNSKLYCNRLIENVNNASWSAVGTYHYDIHYWYNDNPLNRIKIGAPPHYCLQMVTINAKVSAREFYLEYLYSGEHICFAFYKSKTEEVRLYFKDGKLIKQVGKFDKYTTDAEEIVKHSVTCMNTFLATFGIRYN